MKPVVCQHIEMHYIQGKKNVQALRDINFEVEQGELFGLIGPDGAGKTSLFRILTTLMLPTSGTALVNGLDTNRDFKKIRQIVGYMPGRFSLYQDLSVKENLQFFASLFHTKIESNYDQIRDIYEQLKPFERRRAGKLSGGMKQKLALCCALVHKPEVLFLDEPTTGVDPVSRKEFWQMLKKLQTEGISIVVSTPYMDEASMCDRIALIQQGQFLKIASPSDISDAYDKRLYAAASQHSFDLLTLLRTIPEVHQSFSFGDEVHFSLTGNHENPAELLLAPIREAGIEDVQIREIKPGIEDVFMDLLEKQTV